MLNFDKVVLVCTVSLTASFAQKATALPIGFGYNQSEIQFSEQKSANFYVYADVRVPTESALTLSALEAARPVLERWFAEHRQRPLPVILSSVSDNASFANFITDAIELQTRGQGYRDLAWHEYTHSTMYRTMDNWFGPAGSVIHLAWLPAWYLEGLAEALSVSVGSDVTASIERYQALTGDWPSYARLHSLYSQAGFSERGYATSGALVSYLLKKGNADQLPELQKDFFRYSMPWWWPWAAVPFNGFLPMEGALKNFVGVTGEQLYERYKKDARNHWTGLGTGRESKKKARKAYMYGHVPFLLKDHAPKAPRWRFNSLAGLRSQGNDVFHLVRVDDEPWEVRLEFDESGWATGFKKMASYPEGAASFARVVTTETRYVVETYKTSVRGDPRDRILRLVGRADKKKASTQAIKKKIFLEDLPSIYGLFVTKTRLVWLAQDLAVTKLCSVPKEQPSADHIRCDVTATVPKRLRALGTRNNSDGVTEEIWLKETEETLYGNRHEVLIVTDEQSEGGGEPGTLTLKKRFPSVAEPLQVAFTGDRTWLLKAGQSDRPIQRINAAGECEGELRFKDYLLDIQGVNDGKGASYLVLGLYNGQQRQVLKLNASLMHENRCDDESAHTSPLLVAMLHPEISLKEAMIASDLWRKPKVPALADKQNKIADAKAIDQDIPTETLVDKKPKPAKWRGRPVAAFPWIGADDALGMQIGVLSIPLMDHLQNETVRATLLYGMESHFPYQEVALTSTRYWPTLTLAAYRQQTYNGRFYADKNNDRIVSGYYDEKGVRLERELSLYGLGGQIYLGVGLKYANLKPYLGPYNIRRGNLIEPAATLGVTHSLGRVSFSNSIEGRVAPASVNENFDYNQLGGSTSMSLGVPGIAEGKWIKSSKLSLGLEGSRTRGRERRALKEMYTPLKTFVPGAGGGYNKNSFPVLSGEAGGLFSPVFGDSQARAKASWTMPVIADFDKIWGIFYLERLDFTAFYNYGAAWVGDEPRVGWRKLIRAHGYNLDLQLEDKGFRFNVGLGTGQVIGDDFEIYATTGFDALF